MNNEHFEALALAERLDALDFRQGMAAQDAADPLAQVALRLARSQHPAIAPAALVSIEAGVLQAYRKQLPSGPRPMPRRISAPLRWAVAAFVALVLFVGGMTPVVFASVPGDTLYSVKGLVEQAELALAASPEAHAATYVLHAERRLAEVQTLVRLGRVDGEVLTNAFAGLQTASLAVADLPEARQQALAGRAEGLSTQLAALMEQAVDTQQVLPDTVTPLLDKLRPADILAVPPVVEPPVSNTGAGDTGETPTGDGEPVQPVPPVVTGGQSGSDGSENANCDNPPPEGATALGWRQRCEGGAPPNDVRPGQGKDK